MTHTHVTVRVGKSVQSFGNGNMSLEGQMKAEKVTECVVGRQCREEGQSKV
jgi:hypothetical protein